MRILISACLLGIPCRYDGKSKPNADVEKLMAEHELIPFCPEIYGGLPTPRPPAECCGEKVMNCEGKDVTQQYRKGAECALELARKAGCGVAILKAKSPSCGKGRIYSGHFDGNLIDGDGVTAQMLSENGIKVLTENELENLKKIE